MLFVGITLLETIDVVNDLVQRFCSSSGRVDQRVKSPTKMSFFDRTGNSQKFPAMKQKKKTFEQETMIIIQCLIHKYKIIQMIIWCCLLVTLLSILLFLGGVFSVNT